jgi:hypothetical protein
VKSNSGSEGRRRWGRQGLPVGGFLNGYALSETNACFSLYLIMVMVLFVFFSVFAHFFVFYCSWMFSFFRLHSFAAQPLLYK